MRAAEIWRHSISKWVYVPLLSHTYIDAVNSTDRIACSEDRYKAEVSLETKLSLVRASCSFLSELTLPF